MLIAHRPLFGVRWLDSALLGCDLAQPPV